MTGKIPETSFQPNFPGSSFKYTPLTHLRVLFLSFVQGLFEAAPVGQYKWSSDEETTEIYIVDEGVVSGEMVNRRPTINFVRGPLQFFSLGLDDMEQYDMTLDKKTKGVLLPGTMTINAMSRSMLESENIAFVVADHIWLLRDLLLKQGFFDVGRGIQVGSPSAPGSLIANDAGQELYSTPISVPFQFARLSSFTPLGKQIVQNINQKVTVDNVRKMYNQGAPAAGHELPVSVSYTRPPTFAPDAINLEKASCRLQPHPLNPAVMVTARTVRPNSAGARLLQSPAAIPIPRDCMEQSTTTHPAFRQKG